MFTFNVSRKGGGGGGANKQTDGVLKCDKSGNVVTQLIAAFPTWHKKYTCGCEKFKFWKKES